MPGDTAAELVVVLIAVAFFTGCTVVCGTAAFGGSAGLPGGRVLPVLGFVGSSAMVSLAISRLISLRREDRS